jgi:hypothetical protein
MPADSNTEFQKMLEITDECKLSLMIKQWLMGDITPEGLATFFLRLRDFEDVNRLVDVFDRVIHFAYLETPECSLAKQEWRNNLLAQLEGE